MTQSERPVQVAPRRIPNTVIDIDNLDLPPTDLLILEVLAARARLGENLWPFNSKVNQALERLSKLGLIGWKHGVIEKTSQAHLTELGKKCMLDETYVAPAQRWQHDLIGAASAARETFRLQGMPHLLLEQALDAVPANLNTEHDPE